MGDAKEVRIINITTEPLLNKIEWFDLPGTDPNNINYWSGTVDISRSVYPNTNTYTQLITGWSLGIPGTIDMRPYIDRDIEMNKQYTYRLDVNHGQFNQFNPADISGNWETSVTSYNPRINNTNVTYNYSNNSFNITWDALDTSNFATNYTLKNYQIYICKKSINNDLILFETANNSNTNITINTGASGENESGNSVTFNIVNGLYFFYIAPVIEKPNEDPPLVKSLSIDNFKSGSIFAEPSFRFNISPETPSDFKITSPYTNGKISFSWKSTNPIPNKYILTITNTTINSTITKNINTTNYTLDNSDLTSSNALQPGNYTVSILASYNSSDTIQSSSSSNLTFTIPITNIVFTKKLLDSQGEITTNIKNGVAGIQLDWNKLGYAHHYKINVKQYNEMLNLQSPSLDYIVAGSSNSIQFAWNFPNEKSVFEFKMSYSTDSITIPNIEDSDALGESYLGVSGTDYDVLFNNSGGGSGGPPAGAFIPVPEGG